MSAISGQKTVTTAGTEEALGDQQINGPLMVKALNANTGLIFIGNAGGGVVASGSGMELDAGEVAIFDWVGNLASIMVDSAVDGEGVAWLCLNV
jgi:hypothetical protein